jgi:hypothetical protein
MGLMVSSNRVSNDLREIELIKSEQDCSLSSFRRVTLTPICSCNPPADLDRRREVGVVTDWSRPTAPKKAPSAFLSTAHGARGEGNVYYLHASSPAVEVSGGKARGLSRLCG